MMKSMRDAAAAHAHGLDAAGVDPLADQASLMASARFCVSSFGDAIGA